MKKIGITGSLSSGKTTASKILSYRKGPLFSADNEVKKIYGIEALNLIPCGVKYSTVICSVAHKDFLKLDKKDWDNIITEDGFFFDLKGFLPRELDVIRP